LKDLFARSKQFSLFISADFRFVCVDLVLVTDDEMQRLRLAFKRCSGVSGFMPQPVFAREVLGDGVPSKVAEVRKSSPSTFTPVYLFLSIFDPS